MPEEIKDQQAPSTLKSYVDSASGAVQSTIGSLTGNTGKQAEGEVAKDKAKTEHEQSQTAVKAGGYTVSTSGGVAKDNEERSNGSWNQTIGSAKETVGGLIGNESLKEAGREQNLEGQQQEAKGQLSDLAGGIQDRTKGAVGGAMASVMGDDKSQAQYEQMRADGKAAQRGVEADLQKKAEAEEKAKE